MGVGKLKAFDEERELRGEKYICFVIQPAFVDAFWRTEKTGAGFRRFRVPRTWSLCRKTISSCLETEKVRENE